jgi:hypothetical protein
MQASAELDDVLLIVREAVPQKNKRLLVLTSRVSVMKQLLEQQAFTLCTWKTLLHLILIDY